MLEYWMANNASGANASEFVIEEILEDPGVAVLYGGYPPWLLYFAAGCCVLFMLVGIPGNLITVAALFRTKKLRNATAVFIMNLSLSDLMFCCFNLPLATSTFWHGTWLYGPLLCRLFPLLRYGLLAVSIFTVLAITINRYVMIGHPSLYPKLYKPKFLALMVLGTWTCAFGALIATWFEFWGRFGLDPAIGSCSILPDVNGRSPKEFLFILAFVTPCSAIIVCYARIFYIVRRTAIRSRRNKVTTELTKSTLEVKYIKNLEDSAIGSSCGATLTTENGTSPMRTEKTSFPNAASPRHSPGHRDAPLFVYDFSKKPESVSQHYRRFPLDGDPHENVANPRRSASSRCGEHPRGQNVTFGDEEADDTSDSTREGPEEPPKLVQRDDSLESSLTRQRSRGENLNGPLARSGIGNVEEKSAESQSVAFGESKKRLENSEQLRNSKTAPGDRQRDAFDFSETTYETVRSHPGGNDNDDIPFIDIGYQSQNGDEDADSSWSRSRSLNRAIVPNFRLTKPEIRSGEERKTNVDRPCERQILDLQNFKVVATGSSRAEHNRLEVPKRYLQDSPENSSSPLATKYDDISEDYGSSRSDSPSTERKADRRVNIARTGSRFGRVGRVKTCETGKMSTKDKKLLKMILVIFLSFLICYLPITVTKTFRDVIDWRGLNIAGYILIYLTTCINPVIYVVMSSEYRSAYKNVLLCRSDSSASSNRQQVAAGLREKKKVSN